MSSHKGFPFLGTPEPQKNLTLCPWLGVQSNERNLITFAQNI